jgi:glycosyltransferase involved in cell wall biosynthesis
MPVEVTPVGHVAELPDAVAGVVDRHVAGLLRGQPAAAVDQPYRATWDAASRTLTAHYPDGLAVRVVLQVNSALPSGHPTVVRPPLELVDGVWRQAEPAGVVLPAHAPADPAVRAGFVHSELTNAWRTLHDELHAAVRPHTDAHWLAALEEGPFDVPVLGADQITFRDAAAVEPVAPRPLTPETVRQTLADPAAPQQIVRWMQEHLAVRAEDGSFVPHSAEEIAATVARLQDDATRAIAGSIGPHGGDELHKSGAARTNLDIWQNGGEVAQTVESVLDVARLIDIDLTGIRIVLVVDADEIRYLDAQEASAYTPVELAGAEIRLGPASFADGETLAVTVAHEHAHVEQLRAGVDVSTSTRRSLEDAAYAREGPALERYRARSGSGSHGAEGAVLDRDGVRSPASGRPAGIGDAAGGRDHARGGPPGRGDGHADDRAGGGVRDSGGPQNRPHHAPPGTDGPNAGGRGPRADQLDLSRPLDRPAEPPADPAHGFWTDPPWVREERRPSVDELIPSSDAEVAAWGDPIRQEVARQLDGREFAGLRLRLDLSDPNSVSVMRHDITVRADILDPERGHVGQTVRVFHRDHDGSLYAEHIALRLSPDVQGRGFGSEWNRFLEDWYRYSGVHHIEIHASSSVGGFASARGGYDWAPNTEHRANAVLGRLRAEMRALDESIAELRQQREAAQQVLDRAARHPFGSANYPTPFEVAHAGWNGQHGRDATWIGKRAMLGADWKGVKPISDGGLLHPRPRITAAEVPHSQFHAYGREVPEPDVVTAAARAASDGIVGRLPPDAPLHGLRVDVVAADADGMAGAVARSVPLEDGGYRIEVSDRAADLVIERAVAHEVAELSAILDRAANGLDLTPPDALRSGEVVDGTRLSPHDLGRLAEMDVLTRMLDDPARAGYARSELAALRDHLGLRPDQPGAAARRQLVEEHLGTGALSALSALSTRGDATPAGGAAASTGRLHILGFAADGEVLAVRLSTVLGGIGDDVLLRAPGVPNRELAPGVRLLGADPIPGVTGRLSPLLRADGLPADVDVLIGFGEAAGVADLRRDAYPQARVVQVLDRAPRQGDSAHLRLLVRADLVVAVGPEVARRVRAMLDGLGVDAPPRVHEIPGWFDPRTADAERDLHEAIHSAGDRVSRVDDEAWNRGLSPREVVLRHAGVEAAPADGRLRVMTTFVAWSSEAGGGATANRQLAESFAVAGAEVYVRVPGEAGRIADQPRAGVHVVEAEPVWGIVDATGQPDRRALIMSLDHLPAHVDIVVGHSRFSGGAARWLAEHVYPNARYVHVLHSLPEQLDALRGTPADGVRHAATERVLMRDADLVAGVGPLLAREAARLSGGPPPPVHTMISDMAAAPGEPPARPAGRTGFDMLIQGRVGDPLKGVEFAARVVAALRADGIDVRLTVRGAAPGTAQAQAAVLTGIVGTEVTVKVRTTDGRELTRDLYEADLVLMPSVHEGFGMVASEAARAGVPVLVGEGTGAGMFFGDPAYVPAILGEAATVRDGVTVQAVWDALAATADPRQAVALLDERRLATWVEHVSGVLESPGAGRQRALDLQRFLDAQYPPGNAARRLLEAMSGPARGAAFEPGPAPPTPAPGARTTPTTPTAIGTAPDAPAELARPIRAVAVPVPHAAPEVDSLGADVAGLGADVAGIAERAGVPRTDLDVTLARPETGGPVVRVYSDDAFLSAARHWDPDRHAAVGPRPFGLDGALPEPLAHDAIPGLRDWARAIAGTEDVRVEVRPSRDARFAAPDEVWLHRRELAPPPEPARPYPETGRGGVPLGLDEHGHVMPIDRSGYQLRDRDLAFIGRDQPVAAIDHAAIDLAVRGEVPLGMPPHRWAEWRSSLREALAADGIDPRTVDVRLRGSAAEMFSGVRKSMPTEESLAADQRAGRIDQHTHDTAVRRLGEWFGGDRDRPIARPFDAMYRLGLDAERSDYDLNFSSDTMFGKALALWDEARYGGVDPDGSRKAPIKAAERNHGYLSNKDLIVDAFPRLAAWATYWEQQLGRPVSYAVFLLRGPDVTTARPGHQGISLHYRDTDWVVQRAEEP